MKLRRVGKQWITDPTTEKRTEPFYYLYQQGEPEEIYYFAYISHISDVVEDLATPDPHIT